jgi:hypothetical protein
MCVSPAVSIPGQIPSSNGIVLCLLTRRPKIALSPDSAIHTCYIILLPLPCRRRGILRSEMHPQDNIKAPRKKDGTNHRETLTSDMSTSSIAFSCNKTPSGPYATSTSKAKQRASLISRLKIAGSASHSHSRSPSISSLAVTEASSCRSSLEFSPASSFFDRQDSGAKSILLRGGRMLRRQGSKFNLPLFLQEDEIQRHNMEVSETCQRPQQSQKKTMGLQSKPAHPLIRSSALKFVVQT